MAIHTVVSSRGKSKECLATFIERQTHFYVAMKIENHSTTEMYWAIHELSEHFPKDTVKTYTFDREKEFSKWKEIEPEGKIPVEIFFGDPGAPGQRGLNENWNSIVRQDRPKSTDLSIYSQENLNEIPMKYHRVPRRSLNYDTPEEIMKKATELDFLIPIA